MNKRQFIQSGVILAFAALATGAAFGDAYPTRPVKIISPFPPGGPTDILARIIAEKLSGSLGQPVIVENRAGAGGMIGAEAVARAAPDGYTLLIGTIGTHGINSAIYKHLSYDPIADFAPISLVANVTNLLVVNPSLPIHDYKELISYANAHPGQLTFASAGVGSSQHLAGELLKSMAHINILHVPYKGGGQALPDLLSGKVSMMFIGIPAVRAYVMAGKLRPIAVTTLTRSPAMPDIPTLDELGLKGYEVGAWHGILAPANTPRPIIDRLNTELRKVMTDPGVVKRLTALGAVPLTSTPEEFEAYIRSEIKKFADLVRTAHIEVQ